MISALPVSGACVPNTIGAHGLRPRISLINVSLTAPKPCPPNSGPKCGAHKPLSRTCCLSGSTIRRRSSLSGRNSQPGNSTSRGSTSSRTNSRIQSSFFSNSGSVEKSQDIRILLLSGDPAVGTQDRTCGETGRVGSQKQRGADDFGWVSGALQGKAGKPVGLVVLETPGLADIGQKWPSHQRVDPHGRPERLRQPLRHGVEPGLGRG